MGWRLRIFSKYRRAALGILRRYGLSRVKSLELELLAAHKELSDLRNDYLELGILASTLVGDRDAAIAAREKTQAYIAFIYSDGEAEAGGGRCAFADSGLGQFMQQAAHSEKSFTGENGGNANGKQSAGWNALGTLKAYFTPLTRLLEAELSSIQRELAGLGDDYLELASHVNTISCERDTALIELNRAQEFAERLMPYPVVNRQNGDQKSDSIPEESTDRLAALREKLARTQAEKNDVTIKLAESEDQVAELRLQEAQRDKEFDALKQRLSREIEKTRTVADEKNQFLYDELLRVRTEYAESRRNDRHHIEVLGRRVVELEPALADAKRTIESIKQAQADAAYREKVMDRHTVLLASERDEKSRQRKESLNTIQHSMKPAFAEFAMADRQASKFSWTRIAAGFVFLLGVLASVAKIWDVDYQVISRAGVGAGNQRDTDQPDTGKASLPPPKTIEFASLDTAGILPAEAEQESGKAESDDKNKEKKEKMLPPQRKNTAVENIRNRITMRERMVGRGRGGLVRVYLMEGNDDIDISFESCVQSGGDAKECAFLEKNMFEEGVVRLPSGVQYTVIRNGTGASPGPEDTVLVNFRGLLLDGTEFDSTLDNGGASRFRVDEAIPGLQDVLQYMEEGAKWEVFIPTELAFKKPAVFGGQTVVFELELISVEVSQTLASDPTRKFSVSD